MDNNAQPNNSNNNMTPEEKRKLEIYELQTMLRKIAQEDGGLIILNPDGIFGPETENTVKQFQSQRGLPITGIVNFATWTAITKAYEDAVYQSSPCLSICPFPGPKYKTHIGEKSDIIYIIQIILSAISVAYDEFENIMPSGTYDGKTSDAIREFQRINNIPETGIVDKTTWDSLAENYSVFADNKLYVS